MMRHGALRCMVLSIVFAVASVSASSAALAQASEEQTSSRYLITLLSWLPMLALIGVWFYFMRVIRRGQNKSLTHLDTSGQHMGEIAKQLQRIADALERRE